MAFPLPLVLAGPILRRVERSRVVVWLALSRRSFVRLKVWPGLHRAHPSRFGEIEGDDPHPLREVEVQSRSFGDGFGIAILDLLLPEDGPLLEPGTVYSYNIRIAPVVGLAGDLRELKLLEDGPLPDADPAAPPGVALGWALGRLPSFVTCPNRIEDLVLIHASCRNPSVVGDDALAYFDPMIESTLADPTRRPHQLFLTGDQIYADDVPGPLLPQLTDIAKDLLGFEEPITVDANLTAPLNRANFPATTRLKLSRVTARLSSNEADNHLIGLGEFLAMYLVAWSPALWRPLERTMPTVGQANPIRNRLTDWADCIESLEAAAGAVDRNSDEGRRRAKALEQARDDFIAARQRFDDPGLADGLREASNHRAAAEELRGTVAKVRRVLANVPTYMIFDDHEVSDDWFLTRGWRDRVLSSSLGSTIVRNALLSYALCQGWGNDPTAWAAGKSAELLARIEQPVPARPLDGAQQVEVDRLLGLAGDPPAIQWHWRIDFERHRVVALDTRTRREFQGPFTPSGLIGKEALDAQLPKGPSPGNVELLVLISAPPVLSPPVQDHIGQPLAAQVVDAINVGLLKDPSRVKQKPCDGSPVDRFAGATFVEYESWFADDIAFERLLDRLATYPSVLILSGDVHYSTAMTLDYWRTGPDPVSRMVQLTSSGCRNHWYDIVHVVHRSYLPGQTILGLAAPAERLGWKALDPPPLVNPEQGPRVHRTRLRVEPVLLPSFGWPAGVREARPPDFAWRLEFLADRRPDAERPDQIRPLPAPAFDPADPIPGYAAAVGRHAQSLPGAEPTRLLLFLHNVGRVRFARKGDDGLELTSELVIRNQRRRPEPTASAVGVLQTTRVAPRPGARPRIGAATVG